MDRLLIEHAYFLPFKKSNSEFKQQLKKKLTMHLVSIYYIYDTNKNSPNHSNVILDQSIFI